MFLYWLMFFANIWKKYHMSKHFKINKEKPLQILNFGDVMVFLKEAFFKKKNNRINIL